MTIPTAAIDRFWKLVKKASPSECWIWVGNRNSRGYGRFSPYPKRRDAKGYRPARKLAHRFLWEQLNGPVPNGLEVCHSCDNPTCVNPSHLWLATHKQNMEDMVRKNRQARIRGESHGLAKLTRNKVIKIRQLKALGHSFNQLADLFSVSKRCIQKVINRENWAHVV